MFLGFYGIDIKATHQLVHQCLSQSMQSAVQGTQGVKRKRQ
jgi:hypothetical protein